MNQTRDKSHDMAGDEGNKSNNRLQRGTFSTATITKRSHPGRSSYQPPVLQTLNAAFESQRRDSISSSDHSSLSSNASNYESPYTSSLSINGKFNDRYLKLNLHGSQKFLWNTLEFYWDEDVLRRAKASKENNDRKLEKNDSSLNSPGGSGITSKRCNCCLCMREDLRRMWCVQNQSLSSSPKLFSAIPSQETNSINTSCLSTADAKADIPSNSTDIEDKVQNLRKDLMEWFLRFDLKPVWSPKN